ncbi:Neuronal acetylcholine receptor subunit alpha-4 [Labeo rohita]|uniref:Neuronal acetylcholine receptor subunit alpha-4 n=1 Tax=Labeo rohita TaxID=84645 RepID=A0ABQ8L7I0_LABRO|nr:Neuronal acetylcholine receptor subunit alpha-4 [Labeo rohita]
MYKQAPKCVADADGAGEGTSGAIVKHISKEAGASLLAPLGLSLKTAFLLAVLSLKRVGDLQAFSVAPSYLDFAPGMAKAFLHPKPGYIPKAPSSVPRPSCWRLSVLLLSDSQNNRSLTTLNRWIMGAISVAYESSDLPSPLGVKAHSTRGMAASKAFLSGVPLQDICSAAGWSTPLTFVRFYGLDLPASPGSSALSS